MSKHALLIYPNQLFAIEHLPQDVDEVVLVEDPVFFGLDPQNKFMIHKQKLVFHRATMRHYMEEELWPAGYQVDYIEYKHLNESGDIVEKLKEFDVVSLFELNDDLLKRRLVEALEAHPEAPQSKLLPSPNFYLSYQDCDEFFARKGKASFAEFYQWQRERFNILLDAKTYKPIEGKWDFEIKDRKRLPKNQELPSFQVYGSGEFVEEAITYVKEHFPDNPGSLSDIPWPTSRVEANAWLNQFYETRLENYGIYKDALDSSPWIYHSGISPLINSGLLSPQEVVNSVIDYGIKTKKSVDNIESFIRNILGWREYKRGIYYRHHVKLRTANSFGHKRKLTADWYNGTTGIPPVDDVINKVKTRGYAHHNERLMIVGNIMFLCEFHPDEVYRWFMEMFVDAYDWDIVPFVYGISQGANIIESNVGPSISSSNYILSMSHYEKASWCDVWDGLYWRSVEKNSELFSKNSDLAKAVKQLSRVSKNRLRVISYRADDFLRDKTIEE